MASLDRLLSPPPNYAVLPYRDRLRLHRKGLIAGPRRTSHLVHFARLQCMMGAAILLHPLAIILRKNGFRFVNIDLSQIGSVSFLDLLVREDKLNRSTPRSKILVLASRFTDGNSYLMNLYKPHVTFVRSIAAKLLLSPFFVSNAFDDNSFPYDMVYAQDASAHKVWNEYEDRVGKPLVALPIPDIAVSKRELAEFLPAGQKFVALHVRDSGFYADPRRDTRNADIETYEEAIAMLIDQGYAVVRIGSSKAVPIDGMVSRLGPKLFDYAHSRIRSERMDCFLLSHCEFFVGLASGPSAIPMLFGVRSCNVNWYNVSNAFTFMSGDLTSFKRFREKTTNRLVPFKALLLPPYSLNPSREELDRLNVDVEDCTSGEILDTFVEFLHQPSIADTIQSAAYEQLRPTNYSFGARGRLSTVSLRPYSEELLGSAMS